MNAVIVTLSRSSQRFDSMVAKLAERNISWIRSAPGGASLDAIGRHLPNLVIVESGDNAESQVLRWIESIKNRYTTLRVILITANSSESLAIGALKAGVSDYFKTPFSAHELIDLIDSKLGRAGRQQQLALPEDRFDKKLVGRSGAMEDLKDLLGRVARSDSTVLLTGETGTGKELAARLIHANSVRAQCSLVNVNCAALPDSLVESELFGFERGAFTGAAAKTRGRFEQAHGGTVFLDEIGDMTPIAQAKILRVIEEKKISHLGGGRPINLDFRLIAATNGDPEALVEKGVFRDDLFYRLNVARVHMPSLREHREDIPQLVDHSIRKLNRKFNRNVRGLTKDTLTILHRYDWPGNVRELMNVIEGAYVNLPKEKIDWADLPVYFKNKLTKHQHAPSDERKRIIAALLETNWNKTTAASKLNWSRMTLYRKMVRHKIVQSRSSRIEEPK